MPPVLTWTVDGNQIEVGPGQALCMSRGAVHEFANNGSQEVKALCVIAPAAIGPQYFRESAEAINAAAGGPPDRTKKWLGSCAATALPWLQLRRRAKRSQRYIKTLGLHAAVENRWNSYSLTQNRTHPSHKRDTSPPKNC